MGSFSELLDFLVFLTPPVRKPYFGGPEGGYFATFFASFSGPPPGGPPETILGGFWSYLGLNFGIFSPYFSGLFVGTLLSAF